MDNWQAQAYAGLAMVKIGLPVGVVKRVLHEMYFGFDLLGEEGVKEHWKEVQKRLGF